MNYAEAEKLLGTARSRAAGKPLGRHTRLKDIYGTLAIQYHNTYVVEICANGAYYLYSGGYRTTTTKARINQYLPDDYLLWQDNFQWYISGPEGPVYIFQDGMRIGPRGGVTGAKRRK